MKDRGILYRTVTPLWPQANGEAESFMKPLNKAIRAAQLEGCDWREEINTFLLAYRITPQCSTGVAPAQLLFNREVRSTIQMSPEKREVDYKELHRQQYRNKLTSLFDPKPLVVIEVNGTMLTASREDYLVTRNVSYFKKYLRSENDALKTKHECDGEDKDTDNGTTETGEQREVPEPRRYPLRNRNKPRYY
jgi:hypothetical protein